MSAIFRRGNATINANLTPMIDVTFLLIVFFVLVSRIVESEHVDMDLPEPAAPLSEPMGDEQRAIINVLPGLGGGIVGYRLGPTRFESDERGVELLMYHLAELYDTNPSLDVNLRADRHTHYEWIEPVMRAIVEAATLSGQPDITPRVNLALIREQQ